MRFLRFGISAFALLVFSGVGAQELTRLNLENNPQIIEAIKSELADLTPENASLCKRARSAIGETCEAHSVCPNKMAFLNDVPVGRGLLEDAFFINDVWRGIFEAGVKNGSLGITAEDRKLLSGVGVDPSSEMARSLLISMKMPSYDLDAMRADKNSFQTVLGFFENCKDDLYDAAARVKAGGLGEGEK
jgi:hypothetical protein